MKLWGPVRLLVGESGWNSATWGVFGFCLSTCYFLEMIAGFSVLIIGPFFFLFLLSPFFFKHCYSISFNLGLALAAFDWITAWHGYAWMYDEKSLLGVGVVSFRTAWDDSWRWRHGNSGESNDLVLRWWYTWWVGGCMPWAGQAGNCFDTILRIHDFKFPMALLISPG